MGYIYHMKKTTLTESDTTLTESDINKIDDLFWFYIETITNWWNVPNDHDKKLKKNFDKIENSMDILSSDKENKYIELLKKWLYNTVTKSNEEKSIVKKIVKKFKSNEFNEKDAEEITKKITEEITEEITKKKISKEYIDKIKKDYPHAHKSEKELVSISEFMDDKYIIGLANDNDTSSKEFNTLFNMVKAIVTHSIKTKVMEKLQNKTIQQKGGLPVQKA